MAYLGKDVVGIMSYSRAKDTMTGDGSTTTLTLSRDPGTQNNVEIYMDGVLQTPGVEYTLSGKVVTFTTAPETGLNVVALSGTETEIMEPADNSVVASHLVGGLSLTDAKITGLSSSKLTGTLPALDGSALTNMSGGIDVTSASDPASNTNPAGGLGTTWVNTTSGNMYVCTDATADANVWFNVGGGTGDVEPWSFAGTNYGFLAGGVWGNPIWRFSLTSDGDATDWADLSSHSQIEITSGAHSDTHGYTHGGRLGTTATVNTINKFPFASQTNSTDIADLTQNRRLSGGHSTKTHGYCSGGNTGGGGSANRVNVIDKHSLSADDDSTDHGDLTVAREAPASATSSDHGYIAGGTFPPYAGGNTTNVIDKFIFANNANATDVGDLVAENEYCAGTSSTTHGYCSGGYSGGGYSNVIWKYTFASDNNATNVGNLTRTTAFCPGVSGTAHGYTCGGDGSNVIDKFTFAADNNAIDVGDINSGVYSMTGIED